MGYGEFNNEWSKVEVDLEKNGFIKEERLGEYEKLWREWWKLDACGFKDFEKSIWMSLKIDKKIIFVFTYI